MHTCSVAYLFAINNVPQLCFAVAVKYVTSVQITFFIPGLQVRFGVVVVLAHHCWTTHAYFATDIEGCDVFAVLIDQPATG